MLVSEGVAAATHFCCVIEHHLRTHHPRWIWCFGSAFWHTEVWSRFPRKAYAKFTPHDFSPIFHSQTDFDKSQTNRCSFTRVTIAQCELSKMRSEVIATLNIWHSKYLERSAIYSPAVWMSSYWKIHQWWPTANERARYRAAGSSGRTFVFYKAINVSYFQTMCIHFGIRIYRSGRLYEDKEGARVFL